MRVYVGQTRSHDLIAELNGLGFGECTLRGQLPPKRTPWFYDNGAFSDWAHDRYFNTVRFVRDQWRIRNLIRVEHHPPPDFIVLPDIVRGGFKSLALSLSWLLDPMVEWMAPLYLALQDGMAVGDVVRLFDQVSAVLPGECEPRRIAGLFVGGTLSWKMATGAEWVAFAHSRSLPCHIGRVGAVDRIAWAARIGADSIDSCVPLWSRVNLARFLNALAPAPQLRLTF